LINPRSGEDSEIRPYFTGRRDSRLSFKQNIPAFWQAGRLHALFFLTVFWQIDTNPAFRARFLAFAACNQRGAAKAVDDFTDLFRFGGLLHAIAIAVFLILSAGARRADCRHARLDLIAYEAIKAIRIRLTISCLESTDLHILFLTAFLHFFPFRHALFFTFTLARIRSILHILPTAIAILHTL